MKKFSKYNSIIKNEGHLQVLYSGLSDRFVVFTQEQMPYLDKTVGELMDAAPQLYETLLAAEAIIDVERNEFEELQQQSQSIDNAPQQCRIIVNPTMACNFKCWYCYENHVEGSIMDQKVVKGVENLLSRFAKNEKVTFFSLSFFGGEPLLQYPVVKKLINHFRKLSLVSNVNTHISFTSNGYLLNNEMITHLKEVDDEVSFQITFDGGRAYHNNVRYSSQGEDSYNVILKNIKILLFNKIQVILRVNYTYENIESIQSIVDDLADISVQEKAFLTVSFHQVWQDRSDDVEQKQKVRALIEKFDKAYGNVSDEYQMDHLRHPCYGDKINTVVVNYNGDVYKCTARDFTKENRYGFLLENGEIVWDEEKLNARNRAKMQRTSCRSCRILPLCGGGCSQNAVENSNSNCCRMGYTEEEKDLVVLNHFYNNYVKNNSYGKN